MARLRAAAADGPAFFHASDDRNGNDEMTRGRCRISADDRDAVFGGAGIQPVEQLGHSLALPVRSNADGYERVPRDSSHGRDIADIGGKRLVADILFPHRLDAKM